MAGFVTTATRGPALAALLVLATAVPAQAAQVFVAADDNLGGATLRSFDARPPWSVRKPPLAIHAHSVLQARGNRVYALSRADATLQIVARRKWELRKTIELEDGSSPQDVAVVDRRRAYVTTGTSPFLLLVDPVAGTLRNATDLSLFADADGNPDLGAMIVDGTRLLVQVRRTGDETPFSPPAFLAVVDLETEELIDTDPVLPGVQAIALEGTSPKHRMQILSAARKLLVSATGNFFDAGGIESIDLDTLSSDGLVLREDDNLTGADLGPFVVVDGNRGYLIFSTDFTLSSHLDRFALDTGVAENVNMHVSVDYAVPAFGFDAKRGLLFVPDGAFSEHGLNVFDIATDEKLTKEPLDVGGPATDVLFFAHGEGSRSPVAAD